jgi:hypothetical protein
MQMPQMAKVVFMAALSRRKAAAVKPALAKCDIRGANVTKMPHRRHVFVAFSG